MKFTKDSNAVSPVIAVILMVAITVVLAATVYVLVADIAAPTPGPSMGFSQDYTAGNLTVTHAPPNLQWDALAVTGCAGVPTGPVLAGDVLTNCAGDITIRHVPSNSLVYRGTFSES